MLSRRSAMSRSLYRGVASRGSRFALTSVHPRWDRRNQRASGAVPRNEHNLSVPPTALPALAQRPYSTATAGTDRDKNNNSSLAARPRMHVLYGSQTGNAMGFALMLSQACEQHGVFGRSANDAALPAVECLEMNDFDPKKLLMSAKAPTRDLLVLIGSCYGRGEPTDNARRFYEWVMSDAANESKLLEGVPFTVFGLGRSKTYCDQYQAVGRAMDKRLEELGAVRFLERGEGDDDGDIEQNWEDWESKFWDKFDSCYAEHGTSQEEVDSGNSTPAPEKQESDGFTWEELPMGSINQVRSIDLVPRTNSFKGPMPMDVVENRELRRGVYSDHRTPGASSGNPPMVRNTGHIALTSSKKFHYKTGDHVGVWPKNSPDTVEWVAERLGYNLNQAIHCAPAHPLAMTPDVPNPTDIKTLFERYIDINGPIRRRMIRLLADYSEGTGDAAELKQLAEDDEAFKRYTGLGDSHSLREVLTHFTSVKIPVRELAKISLMNPLQYRYYSIASSSLADDNLILCVDQLSRVLPSGRLHQGTCSHYLTNLRPGIDHARLFLRPSVVRSPTNPKTPIILVGAASGMALLRAIAVERAWEAERMGKDNVGHMHLFYGCYLKEDFLYGDLMRKMEQDGLMTIHTAFSHEQEDRIYVQHRLMEQADTVWNAMQNRENPARMYVCGNSQTIGAGTHAVMASMAEMFESVSPIEAEQMVRRMKESMQITEDVF